MLVSSHSLSTLSKKIKPSAAYTANLAGAWKGGAGTAGLFLPKKSDWFKGMCRVCCGAYCPVIKWPRLDPEPYSALLSARASLAGRFLTQAHGYFHSSRQ